MRLFDGLRNLVAGIGTDRDKATGAGYHLQLLDAGTLNTAYRSAPIARKIVDIPADDATREWRAWQATEEQISAIEAEERRLGLPQKVNQAIKLARLHCGSAIYLGTGDTDTAQPLDPGRIRQGGLEYLAVIPHGRVAAQSLQRDPRLPGYGEPSMYTLESVPVHPSRLAIFHGAKLPDPDINGTGWGDSALQGVLDAVKASDSVAANILSMTFESKIDIVKIPKFMESLQTYGKEYETSFLERLRLMAIGKGINGMAVMDGDEDYQQKQISFASLPDVWDRFMIATAAAADIPVTRLWGRSAAGMNATGEGDDRNYLAKIRAMQEGDISPAMANLDECLIRSALGARPPEVHFNWRPLAKPNPKENSEIADRLAGAFQKVQGMDVLPDEALGRAVVNALTEAGVAPGLEADVDAFFGARASETDED